MSGAGVGFRRRDHNSSEAIAAILHPNEGYREKLQRRGITPKDYIRQNKLQVKRMQARNREQREQEAAAKREPFKLSRFKNVRPRVSNQEEAKVEADAPTAVNNQEQQGAEDDAEMRRMRRRFERIHVKAPVPSLRELEEREAALNELKKKEKVDFINSNAWEVIKKSPRKLDEDGDRRDRVRHSSYGRIPKYLLDRKEQWAQEEEERRLNAPDPDCPPGMVLLDEEERLRTLHVLTTSLEEARARMNRLPLRVETLSQVRRKNELEEKLREIEDAIKVFDRPKVYVAKPPTIEDQPIEKAGLKSSRSRRNSTASTVRSRVSAAA